MFLPKPSSPSSLFNQKRLNLELKHLNNMKSNQSRNLNSVSSLSYLNNERSNSKYQNKRSFSTNLKDQFQNFKYSQHKQQSMIRNKHKSLSHSYSLQPSHYEQNYKNYKNIHPQSPYLTKERAISDKKQYAPQTRAYKYHIPDARIQKPELRISQFRKNKYQNNYDSDSKAAKVESKLNKCSLLNNGRQYFSNQNSKKYLQNEANHHKQSLKHQLNIKDKKQQQIIESNKQPDHAYRRHQHLELQPTSQQKNYRKQVQDYSIELLKDQIFKLSQSNEILARQNKEYYIFQLYFRLKEQRKIDLDLITRQNQIINRQEQINYALRQKCKASDNNLATLKNMSELKDESQVYSFRDSLHLTGLNQKKENHLQCKQCAFKDTINKQSKVFNEFEELKIQKLEQEKSLMKKEIHQLVYKCEKYKNEMKKQQSKYQKELQHNQKLIKLIYDDQVKDGVLNNRNQKKSSSYSRDIELPVSLKKSNQEHRPTEHQKINLNKKLNTYKSSQTIFNIYDSSLENTTSLNQEKYKSKANSNNLQWCQNQNIRKYLEKINQEKKIEIDQIQNLLQYQ